ncbi:hypothetical protein LHU53_18965 [Rhodoferax sp. U2-2l]|uniref:hypothetical protein n=1 Tax=Rhodoferax sp. U2-2l TaxID=2884000 RepID=UPI001D0B1BA0|nr:hypothetical protein [Rhodoferax sp. U2-2l]MCB8748974.1 hypothetical protein [Rhodoferax sp. U2-2l]
MDDLLAAILVLLVRQTGQFLVRFVTRGRWRGEDLQGDEGRIYGPAGALSFVRDGQRVITNTGLSFIGSTFYVLLIVAAFALYV